MWVNSGTALASLEAWLAPLQERRDTFLVILGQARQRELVTVIAMSRTEIDRMSVL